MTLTFRRPDLSEAEAFAALHVQCWRESLAGLLPPTLMASFSTAKRLPMWQKRLAENKLFMMGAYYEDVPCGFVISGPAEEQFIPDQDGHLWALYIAAAQHRKGIGRALVGLAAQDWLEKAGRSMTLGVLRDNAQARRFYESLGAEHVKDGTFQWDGFPLADCIYIWRDLAKIAKPSRGR